MSARRAIWLVPIGALALLGACGGTDEPACPTDDCSVPGLTVVKWRFHEYPQWGFLADTCLDLGVSMVRVEALAVDNPDIYFVLDKQCGEGQSTFLRLPEGTYSIAITPLDETGASTVTAPARGQVVAGTPALPTETTVNVPHTAWTRAYTGTFLFDLAWGGQGCAGALVSTQTLSLLIGGSPVNKRLDDGQKLDGSDEKPCRSFEDPEALFVTDLPLGPATLMVTGKDATGVTTYEKTFETFVGAGQNNPTIAIDVPPLPAM